MTEAQWLSTDDPHAMLKALAEQPRSLKAKVGAWLGWHQQWASERKVQLFAAGCCRRIWRLLVDERSRAAVDVCEQFVDGLASRSQRKAAVAAASVLASAIVHPATSSSMAVAQANAAQAAWAAAASPDQAHTAAVRARDALRALNTNVSPDSAKLRILPASSKNNSSGVDYGPVNWASAGKGGGAAPADPGGAAWMAERRAQADLVRDIFGNPFQPIAVPPMCRVPNVVALAQAIYAQRSFERMPELGKALKAAGCTLGQVLSHCHSGGEHARGCWVVDSVLGKR